MVLHAFDPVTVRLSLDSNNIQHEKFTLQLVTPFVEGFSVPPLMQKRKSEERLVGGDSKKTKKKSKKNK